MRCKWLFVSMLAGCVSDGNDGSCEFKSATYHLEGEVRISDSAKSFAGEPSGPVLIEAYEDSTVTFCSNEVIAQSTPGKKVAEIAMNELGEFEIELSVQLYNQLSSNIDLFVLLDTNDDGACSPGELWAATTLIAGDHDQLELELKSEACAPRI
jgi:hypothetical protein